MALGKEPGRVGHLSNSAQRAPARLEGAKSETALDSPFLKSSLLLAPSSRVSNTQVFTDSGFLIGGPVW